jgi:hypothetical protein
MIVVTGEPMGRSAAPTPEDRQVGELDPVLVRSKNQAPARSWPRSAATVFIVIWSITMPLVSMRQLLDHAAENGYGMPAFNVNNLEQVQAIMAAADA